jgi:hypothetical protein
MTRTYDPFRSEMSQDIEHYGSHLNATTAELDMLCPEYSHHAMKIKCLATDIQTKYDALCASIKVIRDQSEVLGYNWTMSQIDGLIKEQS